MIRNQIVPISSLSTIYRKLALKAQRAHENAYAPYSKFFVGAALLHTDDTITSGCNWENCIYQSTCAERCAIVSANCAGKRQAKAVAVYGRSVNADVPSPPADSLVTPCGLCRQMLVEVAQLSGVDLDVVLVTHCGTQAKIVPLSTLLPFSFGPSDVGVDAAEWGTSAKQHEILNTPKKGTVVVEADDNLHATPVSEKKRART